MKQKVFSKLKPIEADYLQDKVGIDKEDQTSAYQTKFKQPIPKLGFKRKYEFKDINVYVGYFKLNVAENVDGEILKESERELGLMLMEFNPGWSTEDYKSAAVQMFAEMKMGDISTELSFNSHRELKKWVNQDQKLIQMDYYVIADFSKMNNLKEYWDAVADDRDIVPISVEAPKNRISVEFVFKNRYQIRAADIALTFPLPKWFGYTVTAFKKLMKGHTHKTADDALQAIKENTDDRGG